MNFYILQAQLFLWVFLNLMKWFFHKPQFQHLQDSSLKTGVGLLENSLSIHSSAWDINDMQEATYADSVRQAAAPPTVKGGDLNCYFSGLWHSSHFVTLATTSQFLPFFATKSF